MLFFPIFEETDDSTFSILSKRRKDNSDNSI